MRRSVQQDDKIKRQLDDMEDYRPMFTYWVTTVQILVLIISLICYGFGPFGLDLQTRSGQVLVTSLSLQQVDYMEPANFWLGLPLTSWKSQRDFTRVIFFILGSDLERRI